MITIEEIPLNQIQMFWDLHIRYLIDDGIISDEEDIAYFTGDEYRGILEAHMRRETDRHHMVYFTENEERIGAASYCIYHAEDGKCFILDFWVFPAFRGNGTGHRCFEALARYAAADGAKWYELNSEKPDSVRFWKSLGFTENGVDEYDMPLYIRRDGVKTRCGMQITIKQMETDDEIRGKAYVHWLCWHEAYAEMVSEAYLEKLTLDKCEQIAFQWRDNILVVLDGERVVGFAGYGCSRESQNVGELFALYVLPSYWGTGIAKHLFEAVSEQLSAYCAIGLWVLKENARAIRFYQKYGFVPTGEEQDLPSVGATEIRMILKP